MTTIVLAPSLTLANTVTNVVMSVEAEYGSTVVEGSLFTAAHHQKEGRYAGDHVIAGGQPCPCNNVNIPLIQEGNILISHIDLDSIGGVLRSMVEFQDLFDQKHEGFWHLAAAADVRGAHKVAHWYDGVAHLKLNAWWSAAKRMRRLPYNAVSDVTGEVTAAGVALRAILEEDPEWMAAGMKFIQDESDLHGRTFSHWEGDMIVRIAESPSDFCNHLYRDDGVKMAKGIICLNRGTGAITLSFADAGGPSAREIVQRLWGPEAGGHDGIAGSPRGRKMTEEDLEALVSTFRK